MLRGWLIVVPSKHGYGTSTQYVRNFEYALHCIDFYLEIVDEVKLFQFDGMLEAVYSKNPKELNID